MRNNPKLSVHAELAWLDWLDAMSDATASKDPRDRIIANVYWDKFVAEFLPAELRVLMHQRGEA
jgi:hypothetical protein